MKRYYRDQYGNYGETTSETLPDSVQELTEEEYQEAIASLIAEEEARAAEEEARKEAERQAAAEERQRQEEARREAEERAARERAERERLVNMYTNQVRCGDLSLSDVPEDYRWEVKARLNPIPTVEERITKLENPVSINFSTVKYLPSNTWVSVMSHQVSKGSYYVNTDVNFRAYNKGAIISEGNPIYLTEDGVLSIQAMSETAGDYIIKLNKI